MSRKKIPNRAALVEALRAADGNMSSVARRFDCHRSLIWQYVDRDEELRALTDELTEVFIDEAESQLYKHIREGNVVACIFYLKTRARHRGYSERLELIPLSRRDIEVELGATTIDTTDQTEAIDADSTAIALLEQ
ncbi:MAG: hypothetical protein H0V18_11580 [Pyrinomonadaceae bacterium]|nr:hypothetical protein [Pyrinomonadaceae bacterium]